MVTNEIFSGILGSLFKNGQKKCPFFENVFQNGPKNIQYFDRGL